MLHNIYYIRLTYAFVISCRSRSAGRGRKVANHPGNARFQDIIYSHLTEYSRAKTKAAKSEIILRVLRKVRGNSHVGGFLKKDPKTKRWFALEETPCRISTAQAFRDALSSNYRSSKQSKQQKRWDDKTPTPQEKTQTKEPQSFESRNVVFPHPSVALSMPSCNDISSHTTQKVMTMEPYHQTDDRPVRPTLSGLWGVLDSALGMMEHEDIRAPPRSFDTATLGRNHGQDMCNMLDSFEAQVSFTANPFEPTPLSTRSVVPAPATSPLDMMPMMTTTTVASSQQPMFVTPDRLNKPNMMAGAVGDAGAGGGSQTNTESMISLRGAMAFPV